MKKNFILVDLDHVLSAAQCRDHMLTSLDEMKGKVDWDAYHTAAEHDPPATDLTAILAPLHAHGFTIVGLTGRPEKWRGLTNEWLVRHNVHLDELLMRPDDDYRKAPAVKIDLAIGFFEGDIVPHVAFILDDHEGVIAAFKALNITALHVHGRKYE